MAQSVKISMFICTKEASLFNQSGLLQNNYYIHTTMGVSPWPSCQSWLASLVHVRARGPSSKPSHTAHTGTANSANCMSIGVVNEWLPSFTGGKGKAATERR